ncbi:AraC family transcriptional regulator [Mucilaginibacter terrenus]|uniref:AraC family transcriptional regulator n=1 Tax=Mucilaginibacter terrenus TaxID=2482727 RepID=A0A3E2NKD5_9SPHI|nr:AraC family transcriptional regulator [Mucilaginibacter terrenus]RFZ81380.1 AraC family transcriptional regulator [Mucilaginibacter terrenus]
MAFFKYLRSSSLDNTEMFMSANEVDYFPFHMHDYYCVSVITDGTEVLQTRQSTYYATSGSISITQANEAHKNFSLDESGYSYKTLYVNPEVLKYFNKGKAVNKLERVIEDQCITNAINALFDGSVICNAHLDGIIKNLAKYSTGPGEQNIDVFTRIDEMISEAGFEKVTLDWLARSFCMSKYHFIRRFKAAKGITPQAYVTISRLKAAKSLLLNGAPVKDVAFATGFYDSTHLNTALKKFFGVNACAIKNSNIIHCT